MLIILIDIVTAVNVTKT